MPYFFLPPDEVKFPPSHFADLDGLLAQGGDLTSEWILTGYANGVFLWSSPMEPLKWFCPDPRIVIFPEQLDHSEGINKDKNRVEFNNDIQSILDFCEITENKKEMSPAWITGQFKKVYAELAEKGYVHSISIKNKENITAVAFGTRLGQVFFMEYVSGEHEQVREQALIEFTGYLKSVGISMIDIHKEANLTSDFGFSEISRNVYLDLLKNGLKTE